MFSLCLSFGGGVGVVLVVPSVGLLRLQALLHFSEATEAQTVEMLFREGGDPLLFQSHSKTFAAELIMATMEVCVCVCVVGVCLFRV